MNKSVERQRRRWLTALLVWLGLCGVTPALQAQDGLEPLYETLPYVQKAAARRAAPSGFDLPLPKPETPLTEPVGEPAGEVSSLEEAADEKRRSLSLEERARSQAIDETLIQFGYDIFDNVPSTFAPVESLSVPPNYRIGAGDTLIVQLYGKRNVEYRLVVTREGKLLVPEYGPVSVAGLTFADAQALLEDGFEERVIGARVAITMGELRALQIRVTGDVVKPGVYTIGALSTLIDALLATGGVKQTGSLRDIQVRRGAELRTRFDLYDLLLRGDASDDITLQHNDVIFVPPIGDIVYVGGEVQRPGIYELNLESQLDEVLDLAGGLTASASLADSVIERVLPGQYRTLVSLRGSLPLQQAVHGGDFLRILPVDDSLDAVVMLSGHVKRPGGYQLQPGMRVSDLLPDARRLLPNADLDFAVIRREQAVTRRTEIIYVDLATALQVPGSDQNLVLQARDELRILDLGRQRDVELAELVRELDIQATDYRPSATVTLRGHSRFTGRLPLELGRRLLDVLAIGGGIKRGTDMEYAVVARTRHPQGDVQMSSVSLARAISRPDGMDNPVVEPGDRVYLFNEKLDRSAVMAPDLDRLESQGDYLSQGAIVYANGRVNHPGRFPLEPAMRASDLLCAARGLSETAFGLQAELTRYRFTLGERREVDHWQLDTAQLIQLCSLRRLDAADIGVRDSRRRAEQWGTVVERGGNTYVENIIDPVYFGSGRDELASGDLGRLREALAAYAGQSRQVSVVVSGHTDDQPLSSALRQVYGDNMGLSRARAARIADAIREGLKLPMNRVRYIGFGDARPVASNLEVDGRARNRRVEISIQLDDDYLARAAQPLLSSRLSPQDEAMLQALYYDDSVNPLLQSDDQLTFVNKPGWVGNARVELAGEVSRPGTYVIDRGETLCTVMQRAGGVTAAAYLPGAVFTRRSVQAQQQQTLDEMQSRLDDLMVDLSLSHSYNNADKTPAGDHKTEYLSVIRQLERARPTGRMVIDLEGAMSCDEQLNVALEDGDRLQIGVMPTTVYVAGQVYVPTSHLHKGSRTTADYLELSGGATVLGRQEHAYVIEPSGEVLAANSRKGKRRLMKTRLQPGSTVVVPLDVDRMNPTERAQSWTRSLAEIAILAGIVL